MQAGGWVGITIMLLFHSALSKALCHCVNEALSCKTLSAVA